MNIGISAYFLKKENIFQFFRRAYEKGINSFELAFEIPHLQIINGDFFKNVETLKCMGASFSLHGPWIECNPGSIFKEIRIFSRERVVKSIDFAKSLELDPVIIHPGFNFIKERDVKKIAQGYFFEELDFLIQYANEKKVKLLIENVPFAMSFFHEIEDFKNMRDKFPIDVCYDIGHALIAKMQKRVESVEESIIEEISKYKSEIVHIHFHNNYGTTDNHLLYSGILNMKKVLKSLEKMGFEGRVIIESEDVETFGIDYLIEWLQVEKAPKSK